jgi:hypothetical protein
VRTRSGRDVTESLPELAGIVEQVADGTVLDPMRSQMQRMRTMRPASRTDLDQDVTMKVRGALLVLPIAL